GAVFMSKIFISYRRHDSRPVATLIYDPLARHFEAKFGAGAVFMDVHGIPLGVNFRSYLNEQVASAELLLALIADRWLTAVDEHGSRRIDSPNDFVRIEIEAALKRGVPVVPVYVDDAKFLREADLPDGLKELVWMNGFQLRTDARYFAADAARLIASLAPHLAPSADDKARAKKYAGGGDEHYNKGDYDRAIADYDQAISLNPQYATAYYSRGLAYYNKGDYDRAIADYDQAIRLDPKYALAYNNRGFVYNITGDYDRAIADYDQAIRLDSKYVFAYNNRGNAYVSKGEYNRAIADFDHALAIDPNYQPAAKNKRIVEEERAGQTRKKG
ncbi:MAG: tetratricopeptide repeat protein, partial [Rhodomicrobium sp.]